MLTIYCDGCGELLGLSTTKIVDPIYHEECVPDGKENDEDEEEQIEDDTELKED